MCDQSAAEPFKPTSGKDSSAREHRGWHKLVSPCIHCLGVLLPIQEHGGSWGQGFHEEEKYWHFTDGG